MPTVAEIMSTGLLTISAGDSVAKAAALMEQAGIGGLPVVEDGRLKGIITSRDVRRSHPNRLVADAMTEKVVTVPPTGSLWQAKELIDRYNIERLVVVEDERPVGVVTKALILAELGKYVDALTGLWQAEFLKEKTRQLLAEGKKVAVIFLDLDDFGTVDKQWGHVVGDEVLKRVAEVLKTLVEEGRDYLVRYAGDEFAVVTTRTLEEATGLAHRMVEAIGQKLPAGIKLTASAGVAGERDTLPGPERGRTLGGHELHIINKASLASTKAKKANLRVLVEAS